MADPDTAPPQESAPEESPGHQTESPTAVSKKVWTREEVFSGVVEVIVENLGVDPDSVTEQTDFREDLEADSLDLAELIMDLEEKFGVGTISEEDALQIQTVGDAVVYIFNDLRGP